MKGVGAPDQADVFGCSDLKTCADPENFVGGGPTLTTFFLVERRDDPNTTESGPSLACQRNGVSLACR